MKVDAMVDVILGTRKKRLVNNKNKKRIKSVKKTVNDLDEAQVLQQKEMVQKDVMQKEMVQKEVNVMQKEDQDATETGMESLKQLEILDQVLKGKNATADHSQIKNAKKIGKYLGIDCEMVGTGVDGSNSVLARVSVVNYHGNTVLDEYVKPKEKVTDYRSWVSGVYPHHLKDASDFESVQKKIASLLKDRILVGHALKNDLKVLLLNHPSHMTRDTSKYVPFKKYAKGKHPSLKTLARELLGLDIQGGKHCSIEDAKVAMLLFKKVKNEWETKFKNK